MEDLMVKEEDLDSDSAESFKCRKIYDKLKNENPDSFLFFHQEFFYELYFEDAGKVSEILKRPLLYLEDVPTLRFSKEERDNFITTMNNLGYTVALCQSSGQKTEVEDLRGQLERSLEEVRKLESFLSDVRQHTRLVAHYLRDVTGSFKDGLGDFKHAMFLVKRNGVKKRMWGKLISNYAINKEDLHAIEHIIFTINSEAIKLEDSLKW